MAYHVIKRVKGRAYLYSQESYRVGAQVKTKSVFIGAVNPETGELFEKNNRNPAFVDEYRDEVKDRIIIAGDPRENKKQNETETIRGKIEDKTGQGISPFLRESLRQQADNRYSRISIKIDCEAFSISKDSLEQDEKKNRKRLGKLSILPEKTPRVFIEYGKSLRVYKRGFSDVYVVTIRKKSKGNREHLRREFRRALSFAALDAVEKQRRDIFSDMETKLEESFQKTQKLLDSYISETNEYNRLPKAIALKYFGLLAPIASGKLKPSKIGIPEYGLRKVWRDEAAALMADIQRRDWNNVYSESVAEANKARRSREYIVEDKKIWGEREQKALRRAELREELNREKGGKLKVLRRVFDF